MAFARLKEIFTPPSQSSIEEQTQHYGRELFQRAREESKNPSSINLWTAEVLKWSLGDPRIKSNLLRFVDVFPTLQTPHDVVSHLREYFGAPELRLPTPLRLGMGLFSHDPLSARGLTLLTKHMVNRVARQFICGSTPEEAFQTIEDIENKGMGFTLDLLGEATLSEREALVYRQRYLDILAQVAQKCGVHPTELPLYRASPRINLSVKLSSLCPRFDPLPREETCQAVLANLLPILEKAIQLNAFINIDMESYEYRDLTLEILKRALQSSPVQEYPHVGIVFQSYLRDSEEKLVDFLDWANSQQQSMTIRLVKGAYWDHEVARARQEGWPIPVFLNKHECDANFEKLTDTLLNAPEQVRVAIASHNIRSLAHAMACAESRKIPKDRLEFQLLYGMADAVKKALVKMGWPVRVYIPYGELIPGMAYLVRRLLENTANESFLKHDFLHDVSEEELLVDPTKVIPPPSRGEDSGGGSTSFSPHPNLLPHREKGFSGNGKTSSEQPPFQNEPLLDFSRQPYVEQMQKALDKVKLELGKDHPLLVNGQEVYTRQTLTRMNPAHVMQMVGRLGKATIEEVDSSVRFAKKAWPAWAQASPHDRAQILQAAAHSLRSRRTEVAAWEVFEVGKNRREADADVAEAIDFLNYYADQAVRLLGRSWFSNLPGERNENFYSPRGVGVVIAPWNFPAALLTGMTAAALAAGNAVIVKPSKQSSLVALKIIEILHLAGVPRDVLHCLPGDGVSVGSTLVIHPDIDFVAFTGSREVGLGLIQKASQVAPGQTHLKRVMAEMGGKNAIIVDDDADLDEAAKGIMSSAFGYGGQKCSACSRVIVLERIYKTLLERLVEAAKSMVVCPPEESRCMMGPLVDEEAFHKVTRHIDQGRREAKLLYQGDVGSLVKQGYFIGPTLFGEVSPEGRLAQEEIFGPVLSLMKAQTFEEALQVANHCQYALTGGFYSRHPSHIEQARRGFDVGNLYINRKVTGAKVGRQPFGGHKLSGFGTKAGGPDYLLEFLIPRTITENTLRHGFPLQD